MKKLMLLVTLLLALTAFNAVAEEKYKDSFSETRFSFFGGAAEKYGQPVRIELSGNADWVLNQEEGDTKQELNARGKAVIKGFFSGVVLDEKNFVLKKSTRDENSDAGSGIGNKYITDFENGFPFFNELEFYKMTFHINGISQETTIVQDGNVVTSESKILGN